MEACQGQILILHGWGRFTGSWTPVKELLEKQGYRVFYPPLPGLDKNQLLAKPWAIDDYVEWLKTYADTNGLSGFFLLGHSFGGRVSIKFAVKYPEKLRGLILVSAAGIRHTKTANLYGFFAKIAKMFRFFAFIPGYDLGRKTFYRFVLGKTNYLMLKDTIMKETFKNIINEDLSPYLIDLGKIKIQTLLVWGEKDKTTPLSDARLMHKSMPVSRLETLPGIGHKPQIEAPEILARKITEFIKG